MHLKFFFTTRTECDPRTLEQNSLVKNSNNFVLLDENIFDDNIIINCQFLVLWPIQADGFEN